MRRIIPWNSLEGGLPTRRAFLQTASGAIVGLEFSDNVASPHTNISTLPLSGRQADEVERLERAIAFLERMVRACHQEQERAIARNEELQRERDRRGIIGYCRLPECWVEVPDCTEEELELRELLDELERAQHGGSISPPEGDRPQTTEEIEDTQKEADQRRNEDLADIYEDLAIALGIGSGVMGAAALGVGVILGSTAVLPVVIGAGGIILLFGSYGSQNAANRARRRARQRLLNSLGPITENPLDRHSDGLTLSLLGAAVFQEELGADPGVASVSFVNFFEAWELNFDEPETQTQATMQTFTAQSVYFAYALKAYVDSWVRYEDVTDLRRQAQTLEYIDPEFAWTYARLEINQVEAIAHNARKVSDLGSQLVEMQESVNAVWEMLVNEIENEGTVEDFSEEELEDAVRELWFNEQSQMEITGLLRLSAGQSIDLFNGVEAVFDQMEFQPELPSELLDDELVKSIQNITPNLEAVAESHQELATELQETWDVQPEIPPPAENNTD